MNEHNQSGIYDLAQTPSGEIINNLKSMNMYNNRLKEDIVTGR